MSRIKIIESDYALDEDALNHYENDGLTLISVNQVLTHEYPSWTGQEGGKREVVRWTYHFRVHEVDPTHGTSIGPICPSCKSDDKVARDRPSKIVAHSGFPCRDPYHTK